jgi:hypothetical protein
MEKLSEIEAAVARLARAEQAKLHQFLTTRLAQVERANPDPELLMKWRARSSGMVERMGGTQGYLDMVRGRDENGR